MNEQTSMHCERFVADCAALKAAFRWESGMLYPAAACIFIGTGRPAEKSALLSCQALLKAKAGVFSNFRSFAKLPVISMLAASGAPEQTLENGLAVYALLKQEFHTSAYLPLAAMVLAQLAEPDRYAEIAARTRRIYEGMKSEHPFLTSSEDSVFCALLSLSELAENELISQIERCYALLRKRFHAGNAAQSLSHALSLYGGRAEDKCEKTLALYDALKAAGHKYGTNYELPALGVLAMGCESPQAAAEEMLEADEWLSRQKGFSAWSVPKKLRLMYAGMLTQSGQPGPSAVTAAVSGTITALIAQQIAICAAVAASASSAASSGSH